MVSLHLLNMYTDFYNHDMILKNYGFYFVPVNGWPCTGKSSLPLRMLWNESLLKY